MAGHSKWANIKHRKAAQDAKRGKMFTKMGIEHRIKIAIHFRKITIERCIKKWAGIQRTSK